MFTKFNFDQPRQFVGAYNCSNIFAWINAEHIILFIRKYRSTDPASANHPASSSAFVKFTNMFAGSFHVKENSFAIRLLCAIKTYSFEMKFFLLMKNSLNVFKQMWINSKWGLSCTYAHHMKFVLLLLY